MGLEKMGIFSKIVPFFSDSSPISFTHFFYVPLNLILAISHNSPLFSIPPISPPFFQIRLRLTRKPVLGSLSTTSSFSHGTFLHRLTSLLLAKTTITRWSHQESGLR